MRRSLAILKYVPAMLCGMLVVAWVVTAYKPRQINVYWPLGKTPAAIRLASYSGSLLVVYDVAGKDPALLGLMMEAAQHTPSPRRLLGEKPEFGWTLRYLPIPCMLTLLSPLAVGCLIRFRFPLWSHFAWTALIAAELAYYLR